MNYINVVKLLGLLGALFAGGGLILQGQAETGAGVIAAALASASAVARPRQG